MFGEMGCGGDCADLFSRPFLGEGVRGSWTEVVMYQTTLSMGCSSNASGPHNKSRPEIIYCSATTMQERRQIRYPWAYLRPVKILAIVGRIQMPKDNRHRMIWVRFRCLSIWIHYRRYSRFHPVLIITSEFIYPFCEGLWLIVLFGPEVNQIVAGRKKWNRLTTWPMFYYRSNTLLYILDKPETVQTVRRTSPDTHNNPNCPTPYIRIR